ncbi:MAG: TolC family protein [Planctomycetes bacterium]|nr:TolC family protein [Planctomycetota bacterium]
MRTISLLAGLAFVAWVLSACTSAASRERSAFENATWEHVGAKLDESGPSGKEGANEPEQSLGGVLKLEDLIHQSELHSPRLAAAYMQWNASVRGITVSTAVPDATFTYTEFIRSIETRLGPIERRFMLQQRVPNPGKLVAREEQAAGKAGAMRANFEATRLGLRESLVLAYVDLQLLDARIGIMNRLVDALDSIAEVIEARVTANLAPQSALLRVQVELERLRSDVQSLEKRRPAMAAALSAVVGVKIADDARTPALAVDKPMTLPDEAKMTALVIDHPSVQEQFAHVAIARAKVNESGWMWVPDFMFGFEYQMVGKPDIPKAMLPDEYGEDAVAVSVGLTIPWQVHVNLARGDIARAEESAARFLVEQKRLDLKAKLAGQEYAYLDAARLIELYDNTVLPKARQTLELVQNDFTADRANLTDVLDAERALLASELSLVNARADLLKARARLESLVARDLGTIK